MQSHPLAATALFVSVFAAISCLATGFADEKPKHDWERELEGEWEVVEMIFKGEKQDFGGQPERMKFSKGKYWHVFRPEDSFDRGSPEDCKIRPNEIDILDPFDGSVLKVLYQLKEDGRLWLCWNERSDGERPTGFGAVAEPNLTLRILKRVEKPAK